MVKREQATWYPWSVWRHKDLLWQFTRRQIEARHRESFLGLLWNILTPLLMLGLYTVVFGMVMGGSFGRENSGSYTYPLGIFVGLAIFGLITEVLGAAPTLVLQYQNLVQKVVFPLNILPAALTASSLYNMLIQLGIFWLAMLILGQPIYLEALWMPVVLFPLILMAWGLSALVATLGVFFRDIPHLIGFLNMALFYASAIFYDISAIPEPINEWLRWNPVLQAIDLTREAVLWGDPVDLSRLGYLYGAALLIWLGGCFAYDRSKSAFADVL